MTEKTRNNSDSTATELKSTAAQIERDCPAGLQEIDVERFLEIHEQIAKCKDHLAKSKDHFAKGNDQLEKYSEHLKVLGKLVIEAEELFDDSGFDAFG